RRSNFQARTNGKSVIPAKAGIQYAHPARSAASLEPAWLWGELNQMDFSLSILPRYSNQIAI
ncbi:MAG: hypothetical protein LBI87_03340, partial [Candidatus Accumulibacter sp.]|nr:hypothetical protein [Accumulibacter sp.]